MQPKKNLQFNLERKRAQLFLLGLLCSCAVVLTAFEWRTVKEDKFSEWDSFPVYLPMEPIPPVPPQKKIELAAPARPVVDQLILVEEIETVEPFIFTEVDMTFDEPLIIESLIEHFPEPEIWDLPEVMPSFPGGLESMYAFLNNNLRYPARAKQAGIQGNVWIQFVVDKNGNISDIEILRGIGGGCDEEAIRVLKAMPTWTPGSQAGRSVAVRYKMPLKYTLIR